VWGISSSIILPYQKIMLQHDLLGGYVYPCVVSKVKMVTEGGILNMQYYLSDCNKPCDTFNSVLSDLWITHMILVCKAFRMPIDFMF